MERWRVRIRDTDGNVLGCGIALGEDYVLTCAHVIAAARDHAPGPDGGAPDTGVLVDVPDDHRGFESYPARVRSGCWVEPLPDESGDVALLQLARRLPAASMAPLRQMSLRGHRDVSIHGFPAGAQTTGRWAEARLAGGTWPGGQLFQMDAKGDAPGVTKGFSGAAVVDVETESVIGMVVTELIGTTGGVRVSWMTPVETIKGEIPEVGRWVAGPPAVDPRISQSRARGTDEAVAHRVAAFFSDRASGGVMVIVTGDRGSAVSAAVRDAVVGSDRESRQRSPDAAAPVGSIDLALDSSGMTASDVARRVAERMGMRLDGDAEPTDLLVAAAPAMSLVVDRVDDAAEPDDLVQRLLGPLAKRAAERGTRLLVGFSQPRASVLHRLHLLEERISDLSAVEQRREKVVVRTEHPYRAVRLRLRLKALRDQATAQSVLPRMEVLEDQVDRAVRAVGPLRRQLAEGLARRDELRRRLEVYKAVCIECGRFEEVALGEPFRKAHAALWTAPSDVDRAEELVESYGRRVRDCCDGPVGSGHELG